MDLARTDRLLALVMFSAGAVGCQGSTSLPFAGALVFSVTGTGITGTVPGPCEVDVDFGVVPIGLTSTATIQIQNQTNRTVIFGAVTDKSFLDFASSPSALPPLAPGASAQFSVIFVPPGSGEVFGSLGITSNLPSGVCGSSSSSILVKLAGQGVRVSLSVAPTALDFGTVLAGESAVETVMLTNPSSYRVRGLTAAVTGTDASLFTLGNVPTALTSGLSVPVQITYSPTALEKQSDATVTFAGSVGESVALNLSGRPVGVALSAAAPNPVNFGYVALETTAIACTSLSNIADVVVTINSTADFATAGGVFGLSAVDDASPPRSTKLPIEVPSHGSAEVCFTFSSPITMQYAGQVTLVTDDPTGSNLVVQLTGWGGGPQVSCTPRRLDFGSIEAFTNRTLPVICTNVGTPISTVNLFLDPPTASPSVFTAGFDMIHDPYPLNGMDPGSSARIDVGYNPTSTTADEGSVVIGTNGDRGQAVVIPVSGQGLPIGQCQVAISPAKIDFGSVAVGEMPAPMAFEVRNVGADVCVLEGAAIEHDPSSSFYFASGYPLGWSPFGLDVVVLSPPSDGGVSEATISMGFAPTVQGALSADVALSILNPISPVAPIVLTGTSE